MSIFEYPMRIIQNWGSDVIAETDAEVLLWLTTPIASIPFLREMGTLFSDLENTPNNINLDIPAALSAVQSLGNYSSNAEEKRTVVTDFSLVNISDELQTGKVDINVRYYRTFDDTFQDAVVV